MRSVVFAYHALGHAGLQALMRNGIEPCLVLTHRDDPDEDCWWASVAAVCQEHGIPYLEDADPTDAHVCARISACAPEAMFSFYYRHMIAMSVLDQAELGGFNLHGSLLPRYRGRCPVNWQLIHGEHETGLTLHRMVAKPDAGAVVGQVAMPIGPDDTALDVYRGLLDLAPGFLDKVLPSIRERCFVEQEQDESCASYFGGRRPADGAIDWSQDAVQVHNLIRAVTRPYPGAFCARPDGQCLFIWRSLVVDDDERHGEPGAVLDDGSVCCGRGRLRIVEAECRGSAVRPTPGEWLSNGSTLEE